MMLTPPVRRSTPGFNELNVSPQRVEIEFDENIKIESPTEKVIITPTENYAYYSFSR